LQAQEAKRENYLFFTEVISVNMAEAKAMNSVSIAIVTGANKGIGLQVVKEICKKFNGTVILTSRNLERANNIF